MNLCIYNLTHKTLVSKGKTKYFFIEMIDVGQHKFLLKNSGLTEIHRESSFSNFSVENTETADGQKYSTLRTKKNVLRTCLIS